MLKNFQAVITGLLVTLFAALGVADVTIDWGAEIKNDFRIDVKEVDTPEIGYNRTDFGLSLKAGLVPNRLNFVGHINLVWQGYPRDTDYHGLTTRQTIAPVSFESNSAYIDILDVLPSLDIRLGRQIVQWGSADMFNPTNNINALDLSDPLLFGKYIANQMIRIDYNPRGGNLVLTAIWVPVFQPSQLPPSGLLRVGDPTSELPFSDPRHRRDAEALRNIYLRNPNAFDIYTPDLHIQMPEFTLANSQVGLRAQWLIGDVDATLSYYYGRDTVPVSIESNSTRVTTGRFFEGTPVMGVATDVVLRYPKKHVLGFDITGQIPFLDDMGIWFEGALVFPEATSMRFDITPVVPGARIIEGYVVDPTPFFKFTAGADYSINKYLFINGQFIRGFPDEFGAHAIHNYWMGMLEIKMLQERLALRNVVLGEIPHKDDDLNLDQNGDGRVESFATGATNDGRISSIVYFPEIQYRPLSGLELSLGAFLKWGHRESKFAMPAAGSSTVFFRARASF